jgi:alpha-tubulin suppressor-like RCC1 family protein
VDIPQVSCGWSYTVCVLEDGAAYSWGAAATGQLGHPNKLRQRAPVLIAALEGVGVVAVDCGESHTMALTRFA